MATTASSVRSSYLRPLIALVLVVAILYLAKTVILPLALAILLTFVLTPVIAAIQRCGLTRVPAVLCTVLLTLLLFGLAGWMIAVQIENLAVELPTHRHEIEAKIASLRGAGDGPLPKLLQMIREIGKGETKADVTVDAAANIEKAGAVVPANSDKIIVLQPQDSSSYEKVAYAIGPILEPLAQAALVVILVIFMLIQREELRNRLIGLLGHGQLTGTTRVLVDTAQRLSRFLLTQFLINVGFGVLFGCGLFFIGVPYAFLWGLLAVMLRFVPYIGSLIAVGFPLVLAFAISPGWTQPVLVLILFAVVELLTSNVVEPIFVGHGTGVTPIALLIAAAFWTWLWGPTGLVLSTPLTVCMVVLGQHVPRLRFLALLLGDKPALPPYFTYYQRLLARDQLEAKRVVVAQVQEHGLETVYDEVLLPALGLARRERDRGGLSGEDEAFIRQAMQDTLDVLGSESPVSKGELPPKGADDGVHPARGNTQAEAPVKAVLILGCPAHQEAEELSLAMLAQLLKPDGYRVETVSTRALPAEVEARVARENPALVFIAILPPGGLVQARYLCKRLRKRFAELPIVMGYWGDRLQYDKVLVRVRSAGASYLTTSLLQSRSQIRALAVSASGSCPQSPESEKKPTPVGSPAKSAHAAGRL